MEVLGVEAARYGNVGWQRAGYTRHVKKCNFAEFILLLVKRWQR
jgi:hypothetical protein